MVVSSIVLAMYSAVKSFFAFENARVLKILLMCFPLNISFFLVFIPYCIFSFLYDNKNQRTRVFEVTHWSTEQSFAVQYSCDYDRWVRYIGINRNILIRIAFTSTLIFLEWYQFRLHYFQSKVLVRVVLGIMEQNMNL